MKLGKNKKSRPTGYILVHESPLRRDMERMKETSPELYEMLVKDFGQTESYDFFVTRDNEAAQKYLRDRLYQVDCDLAREFQKKLKRHYVFVGSEDTGHIPEFSESVRRLVQELVTEQGWVLVKDESMEESK